MSQQDDCTTSSPILHLLIVIVMKYLIVTIKKFLGSGRRLEADLDTMRTLLFTVLFKGQPS